MLKCYLALLLYRIRSIMAGKAWKQETDAAVHTVSSKEAELRLASPAPPLLFQFRTQAQGKRTAHL